ncbi:hypothetical protein QQM79_20105 [Marinobacteraceae bacterium S3BR75-40.1]
MPVRQKHHYRFPALLIIMVLSTFLVTATGAGVIDGKGNDPFSAFTDAYLGPDGRSVLVTTELACTEGELYQIRLTLNQRSTATLATGRAHGICTGAPQSFVVTVLTQSQGRPMAVDEARGVGLVTTRDLDSGNVTDSHQWQKDLTLD